MSMMRSLRECGKDCDRASGGHGMSLQDTGKAKKSKAQPGLEDLGSFIPLWASGWPHCGQLCHQFPVVSLLTPPGPSWRSPSPHLQRRCSIKPHLPKHPGQLRRGPDLATTLGFRPSRVSTAWPGPRVAHLLQTLPPDQEPGAKHDSVDAFRFANIPPPAGIFPRRHRPSESAPWGLLCSQGTR